MNQPERSRIHRILDELCLPVGQFVLSGSGVMVLHGIERQPRDIDLFVATRVWFKLFEQARFSNGPGLPRLWDLFTTEPDDPKRRCDPPYLYRMVGGIEVNIFHDWRRRGIGDIDVNFWVHNAELVDGVPCVPLAFLLDWKVQVGRNKDVNDIQLIREHMGMGVEE